MAAGPGKYDEQCTVAREAIDGDAVILIVLGGNKGTGFSMQTRDPGITILLPTLLRRVADAIEEDVEAALKEALKATPDPLCTCTYDASTGAKLSVCKHCGVE